MSAAEQGADAIENRWLSIPRVLCFVKNNDDILLMKRSPQRRIFPNRYNGLGGHIERDEDPLSAIVREIKEECGLDVHNVRLRTIHNIDAGQHTGIMMFVFTAESSTREVTNDNSEGTLHWIQKNKLADLDLVEDLPQLLPIILTMKDEDIPLFVHVSYDENDSIQIRIANNQ